VLTRCVNSSLVYIEGDASMNKFTAKDGTAASALSIVQRMCFPFPFSFLLAPSPPSCILFRAVWI